ncbi:protein serine/threonine phosphatase 2C [Phlegmacium glaucopus]|nr:protein serine/threonine phosphatase 2C [Phlegmacium glaucopus]
MDKAQSFVARDNNTYSLTPLYPNAYSFMSDSGVRYFAEVLAGQLIRDPPSGIYRLLPRSELMTMVASKSETSSVVAAGLAVSRATFQAFKQCNEDRSFVHEFQDGLLFGVLDGHGGPDLSEFAAQRLPSLLAAAITANLTNPPPDDNVPAAFRQVFAEFDASLLKVLDHFDGKELSEWTEVDVHEVLGPKYNQAEPGSVFGAARRAVLGTTALVGYISKSKMDLWVASLGDSEAFAGRVSADDNWLVTSLGDFHNAENPSEISRIENEHPGEGVIKYKRVLGTLSVTRALGDVIYKIDPEIGDQILKYAYPCPVPSEALKEWCIHHKTPPYLSCEPSVRHYSLARGDIVVLVSDGFQNANQLKGFDLESRGKLLVSLAGIQIGNTLGQWSSRIGHSFIPRCDGDNVAERVLHNVLFGLDDRKLAREVTMEFPNEDLKLRCGLQDDVTILVVEL